MTMIERTGIDDGLRRGWTIPQIAKYVNRPPQTVTNEIKNRRIDSDKGFRETNSTCRWYGECKRTHVCGTNCGLDKRCKHCHQCFLQCRDYEARTCGRLFTPHLICNECRNERICHLPKKYRRFLDRLGIARIHANEVTLDPYVLGKKFKRHADKTILKQNGVTK